MSIPVLPAEMIRRMDAYTIAHEPVSSLDLMERAAGVCVEAFLPYLDYRQTVYVFCGAGNNGGDGLVIARTLRMMRFEVRTFMLPFTTLSEDCKANLERLREVHTINSEADFPEISDADVIIDALLGVGGSRKPEGLLETLILYLNQTGVRMLSVDMPSGLPADTVPDHESIIRAHFTATFQFPKRTFFLPETAPFCGDWEILDIGLLPEGLTDCTCSDFHFSPEEGQQLLRPRKRFSHKGTYGHALLLAGSLGKSGAAILSAKAALRSGAGLVTAHVPQCTLNVLQTAVPEVMCNPDKGESYLHAIPENVAGYTAVGIGPGLGTAPLTAEMLGELFPLLHTAVIDADALNILADHRHLLEMLPEKVVLTPHPKEFSRLFGETANSSQRLELLRESAMHYKAIIVLKDAITAIATPDGEVYFNTTGNPGMATGGSGDVLTGIILGLLAQDYSPLLAALIAVHYHGKAGDSVAAQRGQAALIAGDLIEALRLQ